MTWREETASGTRAFVGHFVNAANPTFVLDESDVPLTPTGDGPGQADVREPISSTCIATPFNMDGQACQGGAVGTPFFLFTNGTSPLGLFADAYQPDVPVTGAASGVSTSAATLNGTVNPEGAAVKVSFQFGTTTAYGQSTPAQTLALGNAPAAFTAQLTGLPAGTTIHYRAVASSDFGTFTGADQTLTTGSNPTPPAHGTVTVGHAKVNGSTVAVRVTCSGAPCKVTVKLTARNQHHKQVGVGSTSVTLAAGQTHDRADPPQPGRTASARHPARVEGDAPRDPVARWRAHLDHQHPDRDHQDPRPQAPLTHRPMRPRPPTGGRGRIFVPLHGRDPRVHAARGRSAPDLRARVHRDPARAGQAGRSEPLLRGVTPVLGDARGRGHPSEARVVASRATAVSKRAQGSATP